MGDVLGGDAYCHCANKRQQGTPDADNCLLRLLHCDLPLSPRVRRMIKRFIAQRRFDDIATWSRAYKLKWIASHECERTLGSRLQDAEIGRGSNSDLIHFINACST